MRMVIVGSVLVVDIPSEVEISAQSSVKIYEKLYPDVDFSKTSVYILSRTRLSIKVAVAAEEEMIDVVTEEEIIEEAAEEEIKMIR